jgi:hypothetical protein
LRCLLCLATFLGACAHEEGTGVGEWLIDKNRQISQVIDDTAEKIDVYVANAKLVDDPNRSRVVFYNAFRVSEGGERKYSPHFGAKLHLPNVQEKVQISVTSYDEDLVERGINEKRYQTKPSEQTYGTSLALIRQLGSVTTEFRPRVEYTDEVLTSYLFKFSSTAERGAFRVMPQLQLFARSNDGTGQFVAVNLGFKLSEKDDLVVVNEEQYTDGDNTMSTNHGLEWEHTWSEEFSIENAVIVESNNRETYHLDQTVVSSSFRHKFQRNVLHYSVTPHVAFAKAAHYHPLTGLDLRVDVIF